MREVNKLGKKLEMPSYSGDLKMVKVKRGEKDHETSRSLVFRISRTLPKSSFDDSGIKCSSSEEEETSSEEMEENPSSSVRIKIPKSALHNSDKESESDLSGCSSPEDLPAQNEGENSTVLDDNVISEDIEDSNAVSAYFQDNTLFTDVHVGNTMPTNLQDNTVSLDSQDGNTTTSDIQDHSILPIDNERKSTVPNDFHAKSTLPVDVEDHITLSTDSQNNSTMTIDAQDDDSTLSADLHDISTPPIDIQDHNKMLSEVCNNSTMSTDIQDNTNSTDTDKTHNGFEDESKSSEFRLRRSSRRILLRLQKDSQPSSVDLAPDVDHKSSSESSNNYGKQSHSMGRQRRRRGRRTGPRVADYKKRKYLRQGKPPRSMESSCSDNVNSISTDSVNPDNNSSAFKPPDNTVWTLVPKELFESEFFQSQVINFRYSAPVEKSNLSESPSFLPSATTPLVRYSGRIQLKFPKLMVNTVPAIRPIAPCERDRKRPTVIYFKSERKNFGSYPPDRRSEMNLLHHFSNSELSKTQNDLLNLCNKYRMLDVNIIKKCYELRNGDAIETDSILSDLISRNPTLHSEKTVGVQDSQYNVTNYSAFDLQRPDPVPPVQSMDVSGSLTSAEDVDTLSRRIIIQSMLILYNEEAVLQ